MLVEALSGAFVTRVRDVPLAATWANLLRLVPEGGVAAKDLPALACLSRRAMISTVKASARMGLVRVDGDALHLTDAGRAVRPATSTGAGACPPLAQLVAQLELEHPHHVTPYGTADVSMTGGPGVDWKPVPRRGGDTAALPLAALLSQALTAFAIAYERRRLGPIVWGANMLPGIGEDSVDPGSIPNTGALLRHGFATLDPSGVMRLTSKGRAVRDAFEPLSKDVESQWRERHGDRLVDDVIEAVAIAGESLPRFPTVIWSGSEFALRP
jgi:hypothetical protein